MTDDDFKVCSECKFWIYDSPRELLGHCAVYGGSSYAECKDAMICKRFKDRRVIDDN